MTFFQDPPRLGNQYDDDAVLQEYLARVLPADALARLKDEFRGLGEMGGHELLDAQMADRQNEPVLTQWDAWGRRVDHIELTPVWKRAQRIAAEQGLVAIAYEGQLGEWSRVHQFVANYLVQASLDVYSCPLAMTDGAARTLLDLKNQANQALVDRAVPRLTSRDPNTMWTSGQWMTERTGGSDVGLSETVARQSARGWTLWGTKWFTSAATSEMALTLARPEEEGAAAASGGRGLALFYLETRDAEGRLDGIRVNRLKDKLGTRKVPTAELSLEGVPATPVVGLSDGIRNISSMLNVTRTWNAAGAIWGMRRAIALARDYSERRVQFGARLSEKPLHVDTLAGLQAEFEGAFHLTFRAIELLGRKESGVATESDERLLRLVTPLAKLTTGKQIAALTSEAIECFGGAGYVEDTGLPLLLRDAQVLPIWEGTTNVLSLDVLRALGKDGTFEALGAEVRTKLASARDPSLAPCVEAARAALDHATHWVEGALANRDRLEAGGRRFAMTLGRTLELALLIAQAQWCLDHLESGKGKRALAAARRFTAHGVDWIRGGGESGGEGLDREESDSRILGVGRE